MCGVGHTRVQMSDCDFLQPWRKLVWPAEGHQEAATAAVWEAEEDMARPGGSAGTTLGLSNGRITFIFLPRAFSRFFFRKGDFF